MVLRTIAVDSALLARVTSALSTHARVAEVAVRGSTASAKMVVNERTVPELRGHFPDRPVVPAVVLLEAIFQTAAALSAETLDVRDLRSATFRRIVTPSQCVVLRVTRSATDGCYHASAALADTGEEVATARFASN